MGHLLFACAQSARPRVLAGVSPLWVPAVTWAVNLEGGINPRTQTSLSGQAKGVPLTLQCACDQTHSPFITVRSRLDCWLIRAPPIEDQKAL